MTEEKKIHLDEEEEGSPEGAEEAGESGEVEDLDEVHLHEIPEDEVKRLSEELEAKEKQVDEINSRYLRAKADLENYRRRAEKEKNDFAAYANEKIIAEVLPVVDNLERALEHADGGAAEAESLRDGVRLTINQLMGVLKKFGLEEIETEGQVFNPEFHHAISHDEADGAEEGAILEVFQKGYTLKGRVVRPSLVSVAKGGSGGEETVH